MRLFIYIYIYKGHIGFKMDNICIVESELLQIVSDLIIDYDLIEHNVTFCLHER